MYGLSGIPKIVELITAYYNRKVIPKVSKVYSNRDLKQYDPEGVAENRAGVSINLISLRDKLNNSLAM